MPEQQPETLNDDSLATLLIAWQTHSGRNQLPWQGTRDPYRVWLSEVMLQQTQVSTVLGYYARFLERFPSVHALAQALLDDVLVLWSGLGYYGRARNLHRCAQVVVAEHGGQFPTSAEMLEQLPGIGRSTAAAIAAFCFGQRVAILDGNVKRVLSRLFAFEGDLSEAAQVQALWSKAQALLPHHQVDRYTQGLMDLGATVCHRRRPECALCPWQADCSARVQDRVEAFPRKTRRLRRSQRKSALLWLRQGSRHWLTQRPERGVWASLWSLPEWADASALAALVEAGPGEGEALGGIDHALTHFDWRLEPLRWTLPAQMKAAQLQAIESLLGPGRWVADHELLSFGLPAPIKKLLLSGTG